MAYGDPYCGNCHQWMVEMFPNVWVCDCTVSGQAADTSKDPNCHNSNHAHHDPLSPIVLSNRRIREAEEKTEEEALSRKAGDRAEEEVIDELDEILEDTNEQVEAERDTAGYQFECEVKGPCGGCNLKDDVIAEYKRLLQMAVGWMPDNDHRREIMRWLRMSGNKLHALGVVESKIRAWTKEEEE